MLLLPREEEKLAEATAKGIAQGIAQGRAEGRAEGIAQGRLEEKFDIARQMRQRGIDDNFIHETTNLSLEEIKSI